jgi:predicted phosphodiesterase
MALDEIAGTAHYWHMRYLLISDIHANLPAAESVLKTAQKHRVDEIIHIGDSIAIGPWPSETLDLLMDNGVRLLKGNHEEDMYLELHPDNHLGTGEAEHNAWLKQQLRDDQISVCRDMPYSYDIQPGIRLQHFAREESGRISMERINLKEDDLRPIFRSGEKQLLVFGHIHAPLERSIGNTRFISFGTSGCMMKSGSGRQALLLDADIDAYHIRDLELEWDSSAVHSELRKRKVPATEEVIDIFFN